MKMLSRLAFSLLVFAGGRTFLDLLESLKPATPLDFVVLGVSILLVPLTAIWVWCPQDEAPKVTPKNYFKFLALTLMVMLISGGLFFAMPHA